MFTAKTDSPKFHLSHMDTNSLLSSWSKHSIFIENLEWPSVEHYVQAMKYDDGPYREKIRNAEHPKSAKKLGESRRKKKRTNWKSERELYMTRGIYTKCKAYPKIAEALLATGDQDILDTSNYDYFWGCGRDTLGKNRFGAILMDIRAKLEKTKSKA
jgi:ribA/ribD-fused uncharacterized protein|tara:strand:+ start:415 stop:885 length:471 start_codon:yes stop_codon:yes gene_type:complete